MFFFYLTKPNRFLHLVCQVSFTVCKFACHEESVRCTHVLFLNTHQHVCRESLCQFLFLLFYHLKEEKAYSPCWVVKQILLMRYSRIWVGYHPSLSSECIVDITFGNDCGFLFCLDSAVRIPLVLKLPSGALKTKINVEYMSFPCNFFMKTRKQVNSLGDQTPATRDFGDLESHCRVFLEFLLFFSSSAEHLNPGNKAFFSQIFLCQTIIKKIKKILNCTGCHVFLPLLLRTLLYAILGHLDPTRQNCLFSMIFYLHCCPWQT